MIDTSEHVLQAWLSRDDDWGLLVCAVRDHETLRMACVHAWGYSVLQPGLKAGILTIDAYLKKNKLPIKPLQEERVDHELDKEFIQLQKACMRWKSDNPVVQACVIFATQEPFYSAQRSAFHRMPDLRPMFYMINSFLNTAFG